MVFKRYLKSCQNIQDIERPASRELQTGSLAESHQD